VTQINIQFILDVFEHLGTLERRYAYEQVCAALPVDD